MIPLAGKLGLSKNFKPSLATVSNSGGICKSVDDDVYIRRAAMQQYASAVKASIPVFHSSSQIHNVNIAIVHQSSLLLISCNLSFNDVRYVFSSVASHFGLSKFQYQSESTYRTTRCRIRPPRLPDEEVCYRYFFIRPNLRSLTMVDHSTSLKLPVMGKSKSVFDLNHD